MSAPNPDKLHPVDGGWNPPLAELGGSCDWGECDEVASGVRWSDRAAEWLPACAGHMVPDSLAAKAGQLLERLAGHELCPDDCGALSDIHQDMYQLLREVRVCEQVQ